MMELKPGPTSELMQQFPSASGAYVDCAVPADSPEDARAALQEALAMDDYTLVRFEEMIELADDSGWRFDDIPAEYREMADAARESGEPVYGPFRCW